MRKVTGLAEPFLRRAGTKLENAALKTKDAIAIDNMKLVGSKIKHISGVGVAMQLAGPSLAITGIYTSFVLSQPSAACIALAHEARSQCSPYGYVGACNKLNEALGQCSTNQGNMYFAGFLSLCIGLVVTVAAAGTRGSTHEEDRAEEAERKKRWRTNPY